LRMDWDDSAREGDADLGGKGVIEKLVIGTPPEGIVDDLSAGEDGVLEEGAVKGNVVADAVDDDAVAGGLGHFDAADLKVFGEDAGNLHGVNVVDEGGGEAGLHSIDNGDLTHG
jgi:hypothetical protein